MPLIFLFLESNYSKAWNVHLPIYTQLYFRQVLQLINHPTNLSSVSNSSCCFHHTQQHLELPHTLVWSHIGVNWFNSNAGWPDGPGWTPPGGSQAAHQLPCPFPLTGFQTAFRVILPVTSALPSPFTEIAWRLQKPWWHKGWWRWTEKTIEWAFFS